jgi:hypothetical protein
MYEVQCVPHTEGWIIVVTDITLGEENIFIVALQLDRERNAQKPERQYQYAQWAGIINLTPCIKIVSIPPPMPQISIVSMV